ncbi:MAG: YigZ family protein [Clostridia bacterium]|nr:YigZ family protein [Clostridia bacterium]
MQGYITVKQYGFFEYEDRKSVFIGEAAPVSSEAEALTFIEGVKKKYPDARHHVYAYVLRDNSIMRFTDDREPQGTAGMPVLDAIRKNGCTDTVIVVTRYFGGTLLGTGGLVRAYSAAAIGALKSAEIIEYDVYSELTLEVDYSDYQKILPILTKRGFRTENSRFTASVELYGTVKKSELELLADELTQATCGRIKTKIIGEKFAF